MIRLPVLMAINLTVAVRNILGKHVNRDTNVVYTAVRNHLGVNTQGKNVNEHTDVISAEAAITVYVQTTTITLRPLIAQIILPIQTTILATAGIILIVLIGTSVHHASIGGGLR
jgi:hypothetical protein